MSLTNWEEFGWIEVDAAGVSFCRGDARPSDIHRESARTVEDGAVYQATMVDCPLPVEVRRDGNGQIVAARMCFTDDVDDIEGSWVQVGELDLGNGQCVACDPDCDGSSYRLSFAVCPGVYTAAVFEHLYSDGVVDVLGLSISLADAHVPA
jgi:hypothetical protein